LVYYWRSDGPKAYPLNPNFVVKIPKFGWRNDEYKIGSKKNKTWLNSKEI